MKIFVTIVVATTLAMAKGEVNLNQGNNYNGLPQPGFYPQQPQYAPVVPTNQYLPQPEIQIQQQQQQQLQPQPQPLGFAASLKEQQVVAPKFQMPADLPAPFNFQPAVKNSKRRYRPRVRMPKKAIVTKNFFIHSAPEETEAELQEELAELEQQPRKHYNVLFVKAPSQTNKAAALNLAKAIREEKTVVYVLAKKTSAADLQDAIQHVPQQINKPEVFFIKYRTPEEAANAQHQIQAQYDSLGGFSTVSDEGVAPASSVIGSLDAPEEEEEEEQHQSQPQPQLQPQQQLGTSQEPQLQQLQQQHFDDQQFVNGPRQSNNNGYLPPPIHQY